MKDDFWGIKELEVVFISDQDKRLQQVIKMVFLSGYVVYCCQHIANNIQKDYRLACQQLFQTAAYVSTKDKFDMFLKKIEKQKSFAKRYL